MRWHAVNTPNESGGRAVSGVRGGCVHLHGQPRGGARESAPEREAALPGTRPGLACPGGRGGRAWLHLRTQFCQGGVAAREAEAGDPPRGSEVGGGDCPGASCPLPQEHRSGLGGGGGERRHSGPPVSGSQQPVSPSRTPGATSPEGEEGQESEVCAPGRGGPTAGRSCDLRPPAGAVAGCEHRASGEGACSADAPAAPARAWSPLTTFPCKSAGVRLRQSV